MIIRDAVYDDIDNIAKLYISNWKETYKGLLSEDYLNSLTKEYAVEKWSKYLKNENHKIAIITDLGIYDDYLIEKLQGLDILLLEANHDVRMLEAGSYPYPLKRRILGERGHLSNEVSGQLLGELLHDDMKAVILGHLSKENNYAELAYETVRQEVTLGENPYKGNDFPIYVAKRNEPMPMLCV